MKQFRYAIGILFLLLSGLCFANTMSLNDFPDIKRFDAMINQPDDKIDLLKIKLESDKIIDPSINVNKTTRDVNKIVSKINAMAGINASDEEKLNALKKYLYEKGDWNENNPYHYSFSDPLGEKIENKLLQHYLKSREGNCVSMPVLFVILGQRLGIDVTLSTAPNHFFVKYTDKKDGITYNLEATSGAGVTRDEWYRQQMPMTDKSIESGMYMKKLSKKEAATELLDTLGEYYSNVKDLPRVLAVSQVILRNNKTDINAILRAGCVFYKLIIENYLDVYKNEKDIPRDKIWYFKYLASNHQYLIHMADSLGYKGETEYQREKYLKEVKKNSALLN